MSFPGEDADRHVDDILAGRSRQDQDRLDRKDWALGRIVGILTNFGRPLQPHEREIITVAQDAIYCAD